MQEKTHIISTPEGDITLSTGKIARLTAGAVMVKQGDTAILATVAVDPSEVKQDFFPLTVEVLERYYAGGTLSGSRFKKREGYPSDDAVLMSRQIDHSIRPLFPKGFKQPVNVILMVMADGGENNVESLMVFSASAALMLSGVPFAGPAASAVVGIKSDGSLVVNPSHKADESDYLGVFVVSGTKGKVLNIEGWGKEVSDETMDKVLDAAMERIGKLADEQIAFSKDIAQEQMSYSEHYVMMDVVEKILKNDKDTVKQMLFTEEKPERDDNRREVFNKLAEKYTDEEAGIEHADVAAAQDYVERKILREAVLKEGKRISGRKLDEIRRLNVELDVLPGVHGSALFQRGYTESLSIVTLGSTSKSVGFDDMEGEETIKGFMHHYNFPPFSTGEAGRVRYAPGRREVGHGAIGENGLRNMVPDQESFPYTVRVVSEITTSNGSTSMAATCASSLALMAAGVPVKKHVAGIGVGLVTDEEDESNYKLLLDIEGVEDFYGDMDFKVTGTDKGLTAVQFETKLQGVPVKVLKEAFRLSNEGRQTVLTVMNSAIAEPRAELAPTAPRVDVISIPTTKIGELIGPGGKVIKGIVESAEALVDATVEIDINDDGRVTITSSNQEQRDFVLNRIKLLMEGPEVGKIYTGKVKNLTDFGAFVELVPGVEGLVHISEIANTRVNKVEDFVKSGDEVRVKVIDKRPGRVSLSIKQVDGGKKESNTSK